MVNFVTVKIGEKYTSTYVNRVFEMCKEHVSYPFTFHCYTDNPAGIDPQIEIIPFVNHGLSTIVHNKLFLFSDQFEKKLCSASPRIFFDIDIVIRDTIDDLVAFAYQTKEPLSVINASWKQYTRDELLTNVNLHSINSSCMVWKPFDNTHIWNHFFENYQTMSKVYDKGMDAYLVHQHNVSGKLPETLFSSFINGIPKKYIRLINTLDQYKKISQSFPIVLFNGPTIEEDITTFIESNYTSSLFDMTNTFSEDKELRKQAAERAERILYERTIKMM